MTRSSGGLPGLPAAAARALIVLRRDLHHHPELANRERRTMGRIAGSLSALGLRPRVNVAGTGVMADIGGRLPGRLAAIRVPIDAFPVQEAGAASYRSRTRGVSHACGHDALAAMALGAAWILDKARPGLRGSVRLLFQPAEEGAPAGERGGAALVLEEGVLDGARAVVAAHVEGSLPVGVVGYCERDVYAGLDAFEVRFDGLAAHGALPGRGVDAIAAAARAVGALSALSRPRAADPVAVTVGTIRGGTAHNAVAAEARLGGSVRTYSEARRRRILVDIERAARAAAAAQGARADVAFTTRLPPTRNSPDLTSLLVPVLKSVAGSRRVRLLPRLPFSDDFGLIARELPSFYFQIGSGRGAATHTELFDVDERCIPFGARLLAECAARAAGA